MSATQKTPPLTDMLTRYIALCKCPTLAEDYKETHRERQKKRLQHSNPEQVFASWGPENQECSIFPILADLLCSLLIAAGRLQVPTHIVRIVLGKTCCHSLLLTLWNALRRQKWSRNMLQDATETKTDISNVRW